MSLQDPKKRLLRNVTSNWVQMAVYTVIALIMTPFLVHSLGKEIYGIWALIFSIVQYTNFFDVGFKQGLARYLPKYYAAHDYHKLNEVINSSNLIYSISGVAVIITTLVIAVFFIDVFQVTPELQSLMRAGLIIIGINQAVFFFFMAGTALGPFHRYDLYNGVEIVKTVLSSLAVVYFLMNGYGLIALALLTLASNVVGLLVKRFFQQRIVPQIRFGIGFISKERIRELFSYSIVSFLIVITWIVIYSTDNVVIGIYISSTAVTFYNIAGTIVNNLRTFVSSIGVPLVPAISHLDTTSDLREIAGLHDKIMRYLYYLTTSICVMLVFFGSDFIRLWMGEGFTSTAEVLLILIIPACIYLPQTMSNSVLLGIGQHRPLLYLLIVEAACNITLSLILVRFWGIHGVALGTAIPQILIYSFVYPYVFQKIIRSSLKGFYRSSAGAIGMSLLFTLPLAWLAAVLITMDGWVGFILKILIVGLGTLVGFGWKVLESSERKNMLGFIRLGRR